MVIKFERFYLETSEQPYQVEEDQWVMEPSPEQFGIRISYYSLDDVKQILDMEKWLDQQGIWYINNLIYFNTEAERFEFELIWL